MACFVCICVCIDWIVDVEMRDYWGLGVFIGFNERGFFNFWGGVFDFFLFWLEGFVLGTAGLVSDYGFALGRMQRKLGHGVIFGWSGGCFGKWGKRLWKVWGLKRFDFWGDFSVLFDFGSTIFFLGAAGFV